MKPKHVDCYRLDATETLKSCKISVGQDFHTLSASQVESLLKEATLVRYRKPAAANGSTARYFHDMLQRRARK